MAFRFLPDKWPLLPDEKAATAARNIGGSKWVVKAQVHAGGRGKAGGVKLVESPEQAAEAARGMFGKYLHTHQQVGKACPFIRFMSSPHQRLNANCT